MGKRSVRETSLETARWEGISALQGTRGSGSWSRGYGRNELPSWIRVGRVEMTISSTLLEVENFQGYYKHFHNKKLNKKVGRGR